MPASRAKESPLSGESVTTVQVVEGSKRVDGLPVISVIDRPPAAHPAQKSATAGSGLTSSRRPVGWRT